MLSITFNRFKKKSLIVIYTIIPEETSELLLEIKYKKLYKCILKEEEKNKIEDKILSDDQTKIISYIIKLNSTQIASGHWGATIKLWDLPTGKCIKTIRAGGNVVAFLVSLSKTKFISYVNSTIKIFDISSGICLQTIFDFNSVNIVIKINKHLITIGEYKHIKLYDLISGKCILSFDEPEGSLWLVKLSKTQILSSCYKTIKIYDITTGIILKTIYDDSYRFSHIVKLSETIIGNVFIDNSIQIWDFQNEVCLKTLKGHNKRIENIVKLNKTTIISGSEDQSIKLWDLLAGNCLKTLKNTNSNSGCFMVIKLSRKQIVSICNNVSIKVWNLEEIDFNREKLD